MTTKAKSAVNSAGSKREPSKRSMFSLLIASVFSTIGLGIWTVSSLEWEDRVTIKTGLLLSVFGGVFFLALYSLLIDLMRKTNRGHKLVKKYKLLTADILDMSNKIVSAVQAMLSCIVGTTIVCYSCPRNLLRTSHYISQAYAWFGASYFMYDIWSMYQVYYHTNKVPSRSVQVVQQNGDGKKTEQREDRTRFWYYVRTNPIIVGHHLFIGLFGFSVIVYLRGGLGDCVFGYVYLMEASTPFVSLRGILARMNLKSGRLYMINGLLMLVVFFLCRIAMFPYVMYLYAKAAELDYISAIMSLPRGCKTTMLILILPQLYWFYLMMRGATKILRFMIVSTSVDVNSKRRRSLNHTIS